MFKSIKELKAGDVVSAHGATFRVMHDAREALHAYRPMAAHMVEARGPNSCAYAEAQWIGGNIVTGYFGPDTTWVFQGNCFARKLKLAA